MTVLGQTHMLPDPFFVLATQNPIELEGTYPLPEAQVDRFLFKLEVRRNDAATLEKIVKDRELGVEPEVQAVMTRETLAGLHAMVRRIFLPDVVANYIARIVDATHAGQSAAAHAVKFGASPRAALSLASAVKARALIQGRSHASFEDTGAGAGGDRAPGGAGLQREDRWQDESPDGGGIARRGADAGARHAGDDRENVMHPFQSC